METNSKEGLSKVSVIVNLTRENAIMEGIPFFGLLTFGIQPEYLTHSERQELVSVGDSPINEDGLNVRSIPIPRYEGWVSKDPTTFVRTVLQARIARKDYVSQEKEGTTVDQCWFERFFNQFVSRVGGLEENNLDDYKEEMMEAYEEYLASELQLASNNVLHFYDRESKKIQLSDDKSIYIGSDDDVRRMLDDSSDGVKGEESEESGSDEDRVPDESERGGMF